MQQGCCSRYRLFTRVPELTRSSPVYFQHEEAFRVRLPGKLGVDPESQKKIPEQFWQSD
jgi:hypothetical protein